MATLVQVRLGVLKQILIAAMAVALHAQDAARLAEARVLLSRLTGNAAADAPVFRSAGAACATELFIALMQQGQGIGASPEDIAGLHRAIDGLVEVQVFQGDLFKASVYQSFQDTYYRMDQNFEAALAAARNGLELQMRSGQTGTAYLNHKAIGGDLLSLGRPAEALAELRVAEQLLPNATDATAATLKRDIVQTMLALHDQEGARRECDAMQAAREAPPLFRARGKMAFSDILFQEGKFAEGVEAVKQATALLPPGEEAEKFAPEAASQVLSGLLDGLRSLPYQEAIALARHADVEIPGLPISVSGFARSLVKQRRRLAGDVDGLLREDAALVEAARANGEVPGQIDALRSLAGSYASIHGTRQQGVLLEEARRLEMGTLPPNGIPADAGSQFSYFRTLDALAYADLELGQAGAARRWFDEMLKSIASYPDVATQKRLRHLRFDAVLGKARVAELNDDPDDARALLLGAIRNGDGDRTSALLQLARLERALNEKPKAALEYYEQAIEGLRAAKQRDEEVAAHLAVSRYLATKASRLPEARTKVEQHLAAVERELPGLNYAEGEWRLHFIRGILAEADRPEAAITEYGQAIERLERMRAGLTQQEQRQGLLDNESVGELYTRMVAVLTRMGRSEEAWQYLERGKARSFVEMLQGRRFRTAEAGPEIAGLRKLEEQLAGLRLQLAPESQAIMRSAGHEPTLVRAELKALEARFSVARQQAGLNRSRAGQVLSLDPPGLAETERRVPPHSAMVEYGILDGAVTAFIVSSGASRQLSWKVDTVALRNQVARLRPMLADAASTEWPELVALVSKALVEPVLSALPPGTEHLLIVPSAYLHYLPFAVLRLPDGRVLADLYSVSYLPSAGALQFLTAPSGSPGSLFLGALGNRSAEGMPALPGTLAETDGIAKVYPRAQVVVGGAFTHDAAKQALVTYERVHFATHGVLDEDAPLFSALLTSPAAHQPSRLSLYEITDLPLRARMVVLSACETGLGKMMGGDEIAGLTRTFLTAGANTVVSSLWKVSDRSTALLMAGFYEGLRRGLTPARALRESSLAVRAAHPHPFYWAAFIVTGVY